MRIIITCLAFLCFASTSHASFFGSKESNRLTAITKHLGLHERKNNKTIRKLLGVNPARTPWCGYAVAYAVTKSGQTPVVGYPRARSWLQFGKKVNLKSAKKGDIVVLRTGRGYHVTIFKSHAGNRFVGCGGNQSNRMKCSKYRVSRVRGVRR